MGAVSIPEDLDALVALLVEHRRHAGMSQKELADRLGTQQSAVSEWETGKSKPSGTSLFAVAEVLGCRLAMVGPDVVAGTTVTVPWLDLLRRVTASERTYKRLAEECWRDFDVVQAVRYRGIAEGLAMARDHHADVIAEQKAERSSGGDGA